MATAMWYAHHCDDLVDFSAAKTCADGPCLSRKGGGCASGGPLKLGEFQNAMRDDPNGASTFDASFAFLSAAVFARHFFCASTRRSWHQTGIVRPSFVASLTTVRMSAEVQTIQAPPAFPGQAF